MELLSLRDFLIQQASLLGRYICVCVCVYLHNGIHFSPYHSGNNKATDRNALAS